MVIRSWKWPPLGAAVSRFRVGKKGTNHGQCYKKKKENTHHSRNPAMYKSACKLCKIVAVVLLVVAIVVCCMYQQELLHDANLSFFFFFGALCWLRTDSTGALGRHGRGCEDARRWGALSSLLKRVWENHWWTATVVSVTLNGLWFFSKLGRSLLDEWWDLFSQLFCCSLF